MLAITFHVKWLKYTVNSRGKTLSNQSLNQSTINPCEFMVNWSAQTCSEVDKKKHNVCILLYTTMKYRHKNKLTS